MAGPRTLPQALITAAATASGYWFVDGGADRWRSYAELLDQSLRVAGSLREAGLGRGDVVALVIPDAERFLATLVGASFAGVTPASLSPPSTTSDLEGYLEVTTPILRAAGARAIVTTRRLAPSFQARREVCPALSLVLCAEDFDGPALEPDRMPALDDIAFVQFTSGSTSSPKGVTLTHANLSANIEAVGGPSGVAASSDDIGVSWLPLHHDMGLVGMALGALYSGRPCVLLPPETFVKRPAEWLRAISRHRGTISFAPNFAYDLCVRRVKDLAGLDLSSWRIAGCGAEPIRAGVLAAFAEAFAPAGFRDTSFLPCYGLAEHVLAAAFPPRGRRPRIEQISAKEMTERRIALAPTGHGGSIPLVSCGSALPGHRIRIGDEHGEPLPERWIGEILLESPSVMRGYHQQPALTARTIRRGWLHTGDLGFLSGGELFVCGRAKEIIIVNGRKYHPQDLEWAVDRLGGVRRGRVVAFGAAQPAGADRVVIVVEPSGTVPADALTDDIRREIVDLFGVYVDEVAIVRSGMVLRTTSGKVQRAATKARYERGELTRATHTPGVGIR